MSQILEDLHMFRVLFKNQVKLILQQSLYWGAAVSIIAFSITLYHLYFADQATNVWFDEVSPPARYLIIYLGGIPLVLMMLVSCFLSTRTLAKDSHSRIEEVLLSKPFGNLTQALSATLASTVLCTLPILGFTVGVNLVAATQGWFNADVAEPFEFVSVSVFLTFTTIVSLNFVSLLCYYLYSVVRVAILGVLASAAIVILIIYLLTRVSFNQFVFFESLPLVGDVASDMIGDKLDFLDYLRFLGYVSLCSMLTVSATWLKLRRDDQGKLRTWLLGCFGAFACISFSILTLSWINHSLNVGKWQRHVINANDGITLDLQRIAGNVVLEPGKTMQADITIVGTSVVDITPEDEIVFWLNPGFNVQTVKLGDEVIPFERDAGKLSVNSNQKFAAYDSIELIVEYHGKPNTQYGYQDSALDVPNTPFWDQLISYFGMSAGIFDRMYVALPHATHWLPTSTMQSALGASSIDFLDVELSFTIPTDWVVVLSGNVSVQEGNKPDGRTRTLRFTSKLPMAGISLYASDVTKYSTNLDAVDLTLELYVTDRQLGSFKTNKNYEKYVQVFKTWVVKKIEEARALGYSFPCDSFRLVSVPSSLRLYAGGTFMNSTITEPCTYLIREHGAVATNIRFLERVRGPDYTRWVDSYFNGRKNGENMVFHLPAHYFEFQTGFLALEGQFLKTVLSYLHNYTWSTLRPNPSPYTPSVFFPRAMKVKRMSPQAEFLARIHTMPMDDATKQSIVKTEVTSKRTLTDYVKRYTRHIDQTDIVFEFFLESDAVVNIAVQNSLQALANLKPNALRLEAVRLRCMALAEKIYTFLGRTDSRLLLQEISNKFRYQNIAVSDVFDTADSLELPVREIMEGWFDETEKFHFHFSPATFSKHFNPHTQEPFYQVSFDVANTGSTAGVFRALLRVAQESTESDSILGPVADRELWLTSLNSAGYYWGPRILVPAGTTREVGIVTNTQPYRVNLKSADVSYVNEVNLLVHYDTSLPEDTEQVPFEGTRTSTWTPESIHGIVLDDIDLTVQPADDGVIRYDQNLERFDFGGAWGNARKSFVYTENLKKARVNLEADLPTRDNWQIELHVPDIRGAQTIGHRQRRMMVSGRTYFKGKFEGKYDVTISNGNQKEKLEFEVFNRDSGWLSIGVADLAAGPVSVAISPKSGTAQLFFDAMRFVQSSED